MVDEEKNIEEDIEGVEEAENLEETESEDEEDLDIPAEGFDFSLNLVTNQQTAIKKPKNLEEALDDEVVERAKEAESHKEGEDYDATPLVDESEEQERMYSETTGSDFYNPDSEDSDREKGPYDTGNGGGSDFYKNTNTELYSGVNKGIYVAGNGNGGGNFYDPRQNKDNPQERDFVHGVRFNSGLEHKSRKASQVSMDYGIEKKKKKEGSYN